MKIDSDQRRFEELLHAYELGLLSDDEAEEFEILLMENAEFFDRFQEMDAAGLLISRTVEARDAIRQIISTQPEEADGALQAKREERFHRRLWPRFVPAFLAAAVVMIMIVLTNWQVKITHTPEVIAASNRLAVMYFDNIAEPNDSTRLGEIVTNLMITGLSEAQYINVMSAQRLHDLLALMGHEGDRAVDREVASTIAERAQARWMLTGEILQTAPNIILAAQLIDVESGDVIAAQRVVGTRDEGYFTLVDQLNLKISDDIPLPGASHSESDRTVAELTTNSPEAYRLYLTGIELLDKLYLNEAVDSFEQALEHDSTFAMVYYHLSRCRDTESINKAVQYADKAGVKDRLYIRVRQAMLAGELDTMITTLQRAIEWYPDEKEFHFILGEYRYYQQEYVAAIEHFRDAIVIDPLYKTAYNMLAYSYDRNGDFENARRVIQEYIALAPDEANPYDSGGEIHARNGRFDTAIEMYAKALEIKPNFYPSLVQLGHLHLRQRHYRTADSCYKMLLSANDALMRSRARYFRALIPLFKGQFNAALRRLDEGLIADAAEKSDGVVLVDEYTKHIVKSHIYAEQNRMGLAIDQAERAIAAYRTAFPENRDIHRCFLGQRLAESGNVIAAAEVADEEKATAIESRQRLDVYWYITGSIALFNGESDKAISSFELSAGANPNFPPHYLLARAYVQAGRYEDAIREFEKQLAVYDTDLHLSMGIWRVKMHYYLALAYENAGRLEEAKRHYRIFLGIWNQADPGIEELDDARSRLKNLDITS